MLPSVVWECVRVFVGYSEVLQGRLSALEYAVESFGCCDYCY